MYGAHVFKSVDCHQFTLPPVTHSQGYVPPHSQSIGFSFFFLWKIFATLFWFNGPQTRCMKRNSARLKSTLIILWRRRWRLKTASNSNVEQVNFCVWKDLWEDNTRPICTQSKRVFPFEFAPDSSSLAEVPELNNERRRIRGLSLFRDTKSSSEL